MKYPFILSHNFRFLLHLSTLTNTLILFVPHTLSHARSLTFTHSHTLAHTQTYAHAQEIEEKFASLSDELSAKLKEQTQRTRQAEQEIRDLTREFQACDARRTITLSLCWRRGQSPHQPSKPWAEYFQKVILSISAAHKRDNDCESSISNVFLSCFHVCKEDL